MQSPLQTATGLIARQPIMDTQRVVVAYELFDRSNDDGTHSANDDISMLFNAMIDTGNQLGIDTKTIFINRTHQSLMAGNFDLVKPEKLVIEVVPIPGHDATRIEETYQTLQELHDRGFRLAFDHTIVAPAYQLWRPLAHYVNLDMVAVKADMLGPIVKAIHERTPAQIIAKKVESAELFSTAVALGIGLFQGYWLGLPTLVKTKTVAPSQLKVLQLFNLVRNEAPVDEIEALLKSDALLGFNLLRLINSAGFGLKHEVTSFNHAVKMMGMKRLFRWTALMVSNSLDKSTPAVVGTTAVVRGRMMELLGVANLTEEACESAFVVGLFSLLEEMLGVPMDQALALLSLPAPIHDALLSGSGVFGQMLALTKAAEHNDEESFAKACLALNYTDNHVNTAHMEALVWADSLEA